VINKYPLPFEAPEAYDYATARVRTYGYDLFSFFATKEDSAQSP
jgi:hypothetical protein